MIQSLRFVAFGVVLVVACVCFAQFRPGASDAVPNPPAPPGPGLAPNGQPVLPLSAGAAVLAVDPQGDNPAALERRIATHVALLRSEQLIRQALSRPESEIRKTSWFGQSDDPRERIAFLRDHLRVQAIPGTALIEMTLDGIAGRDRSVILQELGATHIQNQRRLRSDALLDQTGMLNNLKMKVEMYLRDINAELREKQMKISRDGGSIESGRPGAKELELTALVNEQVRQQLACTAARLQFDSATAAIKEGKSPAGFDAFLARDPRYAELGRLADDLELRAVVARRRSDKEAVADVEAQAGLIKEKLESRRTELRGLFVEALRSDLAQAQHQSEGLRARIDNLKDELGELSCATSLFLALKEEQRNAHERSKQLRGQIEQIMAQSGSSRVADIAWQQVPEAEIGK